MAKQRDSTILDEDVGNLGEAAKLKLLKAAEASIINNFDSEFESYSEILHRILKEQITVKVDDNVRWLLLLFFMLHVFALRLEFSDEKGVFFFVPVR